MNKGVLRSVNEVVIEILKKSEAHGQDFFSEVATIGRIHHVNVVQLINFYFEGLKQAPVYNLRPNGSLDKHFFTWEETQLDNHVPAHKIRPRGHGTTHHHPPATKFRLVKAPAAKDDGRTKPKSTICCTDCDGNGGVLCSLCKGSGVNSEDLFNGQFKAGGSCSLCGGGEEMLRGNCNGAGFADGFTSTYDR
ncbi:uncharacterized protein LOC115674459 [Syzygium oleosum]|uniref:uncharacterized protein LOC115674459 n=1 Tax=Syzygium oleosum TaxID=219896 RepID=UPI0011D29042|nr:uncharacterized protein LOC115674459 [Syzygium oleosum]